MRAARGTDLEFIQLLLAAGASAAARQDDGSGVLHVPTPAANFAFGDDDRRSLFVAATSTLWRVRVRTPGAAAT